MQLEGDDAKYKVCLIDGVLYNAWNPSGPTPSPETIAHGLARLCRYGGHINREGIYPVAEHCIWIAMHIACGGSDNTLFELHAYKLANKDPNWVRVFDVTGPVRARLALLGLVHDAPEGGGLVDVTGPVLRNIEMTEYKKAHERYEKWLLNGWGIPLATTGEHKAVKAIDTAILGAELSMRHPNATAQDSNGQEASPWPRLDLAGEHDLSRHGLKYISNAWVAAFNRLRRK